MERYTSGSPKYSYNAIFSDVCKARFNQLATKLFIILAVLEAVLLSIISSRYYSLVESLFMLPIKVFLLYIAALFISITRKNYLHVQFNGYSNLLTNIVGQLVSTRTIVYQTVYFFSSISIALALGDCFGVSYLSSNLIKFYRIFIWMIIPTMYTVQHSIFDLDRLSFSFDSQFQPPQEYIMLKIYNIFVKSFMLTISMSIISPFILYFIAGHVFIGFIPQVQLLLISYLIFVNLEFINVAFSAHMSIGCLHKGKPISSLSPTPIETLVSGLRSRKMFTKLTAFQELSFRSTSFDSSMRAPIYHSRHGNSSPWTGIIKECILTITDSNDAVKLFLEALESNMKYDSAIRKKNGNIPHMVGIHRDEELFGNNPAVTNNAFLSSDNQFPGSVYYNDLTANRITLKNDKILLEKNPRGSSYIHQLPTENIFNIRHSIDEPILTHETPIAIVSKMLLSKLQATVSSFFFPSVAALPDRKYQLSILEAWSISKKRQSEKLIPLPICHASAIVSLMGLLINALEEDPRGGIVSSVGDVLKTLEMSVGSLGKFTDWNPNVIPINQENSIDKKIPDLVSILYDLSINAFVEIVLKYNELINDVYLDEDVIKLSKWVLDMCN